MKVSAVLALPALTSKIHQSLPLTPREAQRLLTLLTSSFREQLNREHPSFRVDDDNATTERLVISSRGKLTGRRSSFDGPGAARALSSRSTDHHFQSILKNPLFAHHTKGQHELVPPNPSAHSRYSRHDQTASFDPMAWFEASVASGSATIAKATYAMETLKKTLSSSPETSIRHAMATSLAGSKVFCWLWSSGLQDYLELPKDGKFITLLTSYLLTEGRHDAVLNWIYTLRARRCWWVGEGSAASTSWSVQLAQRLLLQLVKAERALGIGMTGAVELFLRFVNDEHVARTTEHESSNMKDQSHLSCGVLTPTGKYLLYNLTYKSGVDYVDPDTLERFFQNIKKWAVDAEFYRAKMLLYHPVKPSAAAALAYLKFRETRDLHAMRPTKRQAIVHLSVNCATLLLQQDLCSDATWVMEFMRKEFAKELGLMQGCQTGEVAGDRDRDRIPAQYDEISNLKLLAGLDVP